MTQDPTKELAFVEYWDTRYRSEGSNLKASPTEGEQQYEWFRRFDQLRAFFEKTLQPASDAGPRILQLGCGTSSLTHDLFLQGYRHQFSIDFSSVAIKAMKQKYSHLPSLEWEVMDVRKMRFESCSLDVAIDKGTLDAMLYGSLWDPEEDVKRNAKAYIDGVARILKPGGKWLYITYRQPHFLRPLLQRDRVWSLDVHTLDDGPGTLEYFGYVMTKLAR